ncbi:gibberellin 2-beta-dioxygenase [Cajanus cajan]|uniref:gibberellin 2beta-dioxygenase n=1 Tax=Cajanus cajan TaxID=3821 RepID=A0A151RGI8_CAJCA|nr:gibberellin 2-beta-dioxygenase [Cajanus cajan]KYP41660.1 Gibberellin 2-beta-dioxygenase [Cajanus cajan]
MVVLSHPAALNELFLVKASCKPSSMFTGVPVVDLAHPEAKTLMVEACQHVGFFKLVNHGVPLELMTSLENEALKFFVQPQFHKDKAGPPDPYGYGSKRIGTNGDMGWLEYLLFTTNPEVVSPKTLFLLHQNPQSFRSGVEEYTRAVKKVCSEVLELMGDGLGIGSREVFSRLIRDERSDSCLRINRYPACPELSVEVEALSGRNLIGFGEHTDPQIISVLRSNNTSGLQICLQDGTWVSIPPDHTSFFLGVGDLLQVMTNGRFKSVKHRVLADSSMSRLSMIYFGGPPLNEKIAPLPSLMSSEEESLYRELTWREYKSAAYKSRLSDNRLSLFHKSPTATH